MFLILKLESFVDKKIFQDCKWWHFTGGDPLAKHIKRFHEFSHHSIKLEMNKTQVESVQLGKILDLNLSIFSFPPRDRVKCDGLGRE